MCCDRSVYHISLISIKTSKAGYTCAAPQACVTQTSDNIAYKTGLLSWLN
jgi:hypothetical protein